MKDTESKRGLWKEGKPFIWLSGIAVIVLLLMVVGLVGLILAKGATHFWPTRVVEFTLEGGTTALGQIMEKEEIQKEGTGEEISAIETRTLLKIANRDVFGLDFKWFDDRNVTATRFPPDAIVLERMEYGDLIGLLDRLRIGEELFPATEEGFLERLEKTMAEVKGILDEIDSTSEALQKERRPVAEIEEEIRKLDYSAQRNTPKVVSKMKSLEDKKRQLLERLGESIKAPERRLEELNKIIQSYEIFVLLANGKEKTVKVKSVVSLYFPNTITFSGKVRRYMAKVFEFLFTWPRESNTEGGVFPAIFGTVMMVLIMALTTTPLGVLTALYLHEYAKPGIMLNLVRLSVSNLAGVPSIVFGIFGLGFFIYFIGGGIDKMFFADELPTPTFGTGGILWASLTLALLTVPVVVVAAEEGLSAVPRANRDGALALGASKFQMIWRVVLPNAMPGILTGIILAVSRGAGEVAPLMITGVVKLVSELPVDSAFPFFHLDRKFMHLGFHIFDVGFQSPNVEAAKPMVYTTTFLLLVIVILLNAMAIWLRNSLRKKYQGSAI